MSGGQQGGYLQVLQYHHLRLFLMYTLTHVHMPHVHSCTRTDSSTSTASHSAWMRCTWSPPVAQRLCTYSDSLSHHQKSTERPDSTLSQLRVAIFSCASLLVLRPAEEQQGWMSYLGKALTTPASYLPSQVRVCVCVCVYWASFREGIHAPLETCHPFGFQPFKIEFCSLYAHPPKMSSNMFPPPPPLGIFLNEPLVYACSSLNPRCSHPHSEGMSECIVLVAGGVSCVVSRT